MLAARVRAKCFAAGFTGRRLAMDWVTFVDILPRLVAVVILTAASGMISAGETALFSLSRHQLEQLRHARRSSARRVLALRADPRALLSSLLLANNAVNIAAYSMLTTMAGDLARISNAHGAAVGVGGFFFMLVFGEIGPKLTALVRSERLAQILAGPVYLIRQVTRPVRIILEQAFVEPLTRLLGGGHAAQAAVGPEELQQLVDICQAQGLIDDRENALLHRLLDLRGLRVSALMVPRVDMVAFDLEDGADRLVRLIRTHHLLRIPAYEGNVDNVVGIVPAREFLLNPGLPIRQILQPVSFVPEQAGVEALLRHFRMSGSQLAMVVDEYGGLAGVVALEDVAEALVGELYAPDETPGLPPLLRIDDRTFTADGGLDLDDFAHAFALDLGQRRVQTLGGLITEEIDRMPEAGDEVVIEHLKLVVLATRRRRVIRVRIESVHAIPATPDIERLSGAASASATPAPRKAPTRSDAP